MSKAKSPDLVRVNINLPFRLVERVKKFAEYYGTSYTIAYILLLTRSLEYEDAKTIVK